MGDFMTFGHSSILLQYRLSCVPLKFISLLHFSHQHAHILFSHPTLPLCYCTFLSLRAKLSNSVDYIHFYWFIPYQCWTHFILDFTSTRLLKILFSRPPMASTFLNQYSDTSLVLTSLSIAFNSWLLSPPRVIFYLNDFQVITISCSPPISLPIFHLLGWSLFNFFTSTTI